MRWHVSNVSSEPALPLPAGDEDHQHFPAFAPTVSDEFDRIKGLPPKETIPPGVALQEQGVRPVSVFLLSHGLVKLTSVSPQGRESVLGLRSAGWYAGAVPALARTSSVYTILTVTECVISRIPADDFHLWLMRSARMARHFTQTLCNELLAQSAEARARGGSAQERLALFMRERTSAHPGLKTLDPLPLLKQMELAQLLAITPEHLSRLLHKTTVPDNDRVYAAREPEMRIATS
jgi:CRP/FNR family transcriptional regulator